MSAKHTPAPWFATYFYAPDHRRLIETSPDGGGIGIALALPGKHGEANAKLIAAAPALADALEALAKLAETTTRLNEGAPDTTTRVHAAAVNRALLDIAGIAGAALRGAGR